MLYEKSRIDSQRELYRCEKCSFSYNSKVDLAWMSAGGTRELFQREPNGEVEVTVKSNPRFHGQNVGELIIKDTIGKEIFEFEVDYSSATYGYNEQVFNTMDRGGGEHVIYTTGEVAYGRLFNKRTKRITSMVFEKNINSIFKVLIVDSESKMSSPLITIFSSPEF